MVVGAYEDCGPIVAAVGPSASLSEVNRIFSRFPKAILISSL